MGRTVVGLPPALGDLGRAARDGQPLADPQLFAGFCLVANGAYIGVGWSLEAGDAADLLRMGTPVWLMIAFGLTASAGGLWLWHTLGPLRPAHAGAADAE